MYLQARRQDLAAGGPKTRKRVKNQKGRLHFKIQCRMYAATGGPNVKWGAPISYGGAGHHWPPAGDGCVFLATVNTRSENDSSLSKRIWVCLSRRVARNFDWRGANNNKVSTFKYIMPIDFKASSTKCAFFWRFFFWIIVFVSKPTKRKPAFIELTSFKSLFLGKFQVSTLDENQHLLVKLSCESACENLDSISARSALRFFQPILQLSKTSSWPTLWLRLVCFARHALLIYKTQRRAEKGHKTGRAEAVQTRVVYLTGFSTLPLLVCLCLSI